jgi:hypothetical protein
MRSRWVLIPWSIALLGLILLGAHGHLTRDALKECPVCTFSSPAAAIAQSPPDLPRLGLLAFRPVPVGTCLPHQERRPVFSTRAPPPSLPM